MVSKGLATFLVPGVGVGGSLFLLIGHVLGMLEV